MPPIVLKVEGQGHCSMMHIGGIDLLRPIMSTHRICESLTWQLTYDS